MSGIIFCKAFFKIFLRASYLLIFFAHANAIVTQPTDQTTDTSQSTDTSGATDTSSDGGATDTGTPTDGGATPTDTGTSTQTPTQVKKEKMPHEVSGPAVLEAEQRVYQEESQAINPSSAAAQAGFNIVPEYKPNPTATHHHKHHKHHKKHPQATATTETTPATTKKHPHAAVKNATAVTSGATATNGATPTN